MERQNEKLLNFKVKLIPELEMIPWTIRVKSVHSSFNKKEEQKLAGKE